MKHSRKIPPIHTQHTIRLLLLAVLFFLPADCLAEVIKAEQWNITADKMTRYENPPSIIAEGNVILEKIRESVKEVDREGRWDALLEEPPQKEDEPGEAVTRVETLTTIKADWIVYDVNMGSIKARGDVFIQVGTDRLTAETGEVDLNSETGTFTEAVVIRQHKDVHLEGRVIEKTGALTYRVEDGWIITCKLKDGETPPWSFAARDADITDGGYAVLKHSTFRIKNVPVFYMPWMVLPVKRNRQTGLLFPSFSYSDRDGYGINLPLFINLSPSSDMTIYPEYMDKRGLMTGLEFRYIRDEYSKGTFIGNYLKDDLSDPSEVDYYHDGNYSHTNSSRYWLRGKADHNFAGWITRLDLDIVSDRDYLTEFNTGLTGFTTSHDRFREIFGRGFQDKTADERFNTLRVLKSWQDMSLEGELLGINDVRLDKSNPSPLWKLPALKHTGLLPMGDTRINFDWDADYVNYWREDGTGANRVDLYPRFSAPIPLSDYLESTASLGVRDTVYFVQEYGEASWTGDDTENRFMANLETEIGTTLARNFSYNGKEIHSWKHMFRPYVKYSYTPDVDQTDLPILDSMDRIPDVNLFSYGLDNFFNIVGLKNGREYERYLGFFKISQGYDFREEFTDEPFTPVNFKLGFMPVRELRLLYKTDVDVYGDGFQTHSLEGGYLSSRGDMLLADYSYNEPYNIDSISLNARLKLFYNLLALYQVERSISGSLTVEENIGLVYSAPCWSVEVSSNTTPDDQKFMLVFRLANIGNPFGFDLSGR
ncbi:MAG: LPS-assembly protein LptD [Desulfobulbaceae bacterium]